MRSWSSRCTILGSFKIRSQFTQHGVRVFRRSLKQIRERRPGVVLSLSDDGRLREGRHRCRSIAPGAAGKRHHVPTSTRGRAYRSRSTRRVTLLLSARTNRTQESARVGRVSDMLGDTMPLAGCRRRRGLGRHRRGGEQASSIPRLSCHTTTLSGFVWRCQRASAIRANA